MMYARLIIHSVSPLSIKECYVSFHKCIWMWAYIYVYFILPISCNGQECYLDMLILYFVFTLSPSISVHLLVFSVSDLHIQVAA